MTTKPVAMTTRERILAAATGMVSEDVTAHLSVRRVAERAGVSAGSLRHFFPTQQSLHEAVMAGIYAAIAPDDGIDDPSVPARDRLVRRLQHFLSPVEIGAPARAAWREMVRTFMQADASDDVLAAYRAQATEAQRTVESWLHVLAAEKNSTVSDQSESARFLLTVLNGLSVERALPFDDALPVRQTAALYLAADAVLDRMP